LSKTHNAQREETIADARSAMRWTLANASFLGIDPNQIITAGDSAGAHSAMSPSIHPTISDEADTGAGAMLPRASILLYPSVGSAQPELSPIDLLNGSNLPPTLILQGLKDENRGTPPSLTKEFCEKANRLAQHEVCKSIFYPSAAYFHGFIGSRLPYLEMLKQINHFFAEQKITAEPDRKQAPVRSMAEHCQAPANEDLFKSWVNEYGYATPATSVW
jgi:acetyl esterase/lipase